MAKIAIDIALIPSDTILDTLIDINANMTDKASDNFTLGKTDYIPHITLLMGAINEKSTDKIIQRLNHVVEMHNSLPLIITELHSTKRDNNSWRSYASVEKSRDLLKIHEEIINAMKEFLLNESTADMFYSLPKPDSTSKALHWVKSYVNTSAFENFNPHISLGYGKLSDNILKKVNLPLHFTGTKIILAHLGTHCTCRKVLFQATLKENHT